MMKNWKLIIGFVGVVSLATWAYAVTSTVQAEERIPVDQSQYRAQMPEWKPEYDIPATEYAYITDEMLDEIEAETIEDALLSQATKIENVTVSHYCLCKKCCGKSPDHPAYGITASGRKATPYVTVAVDPAKIPLGSDVLVDYGDGVIEYYRADDTGSGVNGNHIDLCVSTHEEARNLGLRNATIYFVPPTP